MRYAFLVDTFATEREKTLSVWSLFRDEDLLARPRADDRRGRSLLDHLVHQCASEDRWFIGMLGIAVTVQPVPATETRAAFIAAYARDSASRLAGLRATDDGWWEDEAFFFGERRSRAWILTRRVAHTAHHRGQLTCLLRVLGREVHSTYGPTADTGGLAADGGRVIYPFAGVEPLLAHVESGLPEKAPLPGPGARRPTER